MVDTAPIHRWSRLQTRFCNYQRWGDFLVREMVAIALTLILACGKITRCHKRRKIRVFRNRRVMSIYVPHESTRVRATMPILAPAISTVDTLAADVTEIPLLLIRDGYTIP